MLIQLSRWLLGLRSLPLRRYLMIATGGLLLATISCASIKNKDDDRRPVWPSPPLPARIKFVRNIASSEDLAKDTTFSQKVFNYLGGEKAAADHVVEPMGLTVSDDGKRLYVSDFGQASVFVFDFGAKTFNKISGLARPFGIALDEDENVYVVEQEKKVISVFNRKRENYMVISHPDMERPSGIVIDRARGKIYVADTGHSESKTHNIKVFNMKGELIQTIGKGKGEEPGQFLFPTYLALDKEGNLYITDTLNARIQKFSPDGKFIRVYGERGNGWGMFDKPKGIALDAFGNLYAVDTGWSNVQIFNQKGNVLIYFGDRGSLPGMLKNPASIFIDPTNNIYIGDYLNHRIAVYKLVNTKAEDSYITISEEAAAALDAKEKAAKEKAAKDAPTPAPTPASQPPESDMKATNGK